MNSVQVHECVLREIMLFGQVITVEPVFTGPGVERTPICCVLSSELVLCHTTLYSLLPDVACGHHLVNFR